jgi:8-oxo-dGTP pyrophosphatase MutT (NUDIX family)
MRTSTASLAVIRRPSTDGLPLYLAQWNDCWQAFHFVGGHKDDDESHRACLVRELFEELGVLPQPDDPDAGGLPQTGPRCHVGAAPLGRLEYEAFSRSAGERSFYQVELYAVELSPEAIAHVANNPNNRWVSESEIEAGRCGDGKAVSDTMRHHWGWLQRHELATAYGLTEVRSMSYEPRPIDTRHIELPGEILDLLERLAENTHEVWAQQRKREGWTYGPRRDDVNKHHPCLVPYAQLPASEKEYDRKTALETLRVILALGYEIRKGSGPGEP